MAAPWQRLASSPQPAPSAPLPSAHYFSAFAMCSSASLIFCAAISPARRAGLGHAPPPPCAAATERRRDHGHREERPGPRLLPAPAPGPRPERCECPERPECSGTARGAEPPARPVRAGVPSAGLCRAPGAAGTSRAQPRPVLGRQKVFKTQNHRIPGSLGLEGASGDHLLHPSCQAGSPRAGDAGTRWVLNVSRGRLYDRPGQPVPALCRPQCEVLPRVEVKIPAFYFTAPRPVTKHHKKEPGTNLLTPSFETFICIHGIPSQFSD